MPQVIGQPKSAPCFLAISERISWVVINLPCGMRFMMASTSRGAGMAIVPVPQRVLILPHTGATLGRSLSSASFSRHDFRLYMTALISDFGLGILDLKSGIQIRNPKCDQRLRLCLRLMG